MTTDNKIFIERENDDRDEVEFSFRYVDIDSISLEYLKQRLSNFKIEIYQNSVDSHVLFFPLNPKINANIIDKINQDLKLTDDKFGVYISFYTEYDHAGFSLPDYVRKFYLKVGGQLDVSIVNI